MTNEELNKYILHYIEQDHTKSAIMLTGGWGTGKSYYIQNSLIPFLRDEEHGAHQCVLVSLYGITDLSDINKSIFLEVKAKWLNQDNPGVTTGKVIAKTLLKGCASVLNIDLNPSKEDLNELYQSIDLSGKLIIFEDIERVQFSIIKFLGYVNGLVEQDGVKVLLVANEQEIIKYKSIAAKKQEEQETVELINKLTKSRLRKYKPKTIQYLKTKEKTVSDTITFSGELSSAIYVIIRSFENDILNKFSDEGTISEIIEIMENRDNKNLRSFLFACQKTFDVYSQIPKEDEYEEDFYKTIFLGIIHFSLQLKSGKRLNWKKGSDFSFELGDVHYPLFRFCYNYILFQRFDYDRLLMEHKSLHEYRLYNSKHSQKDEDIRIISFWSIYPEKELRETVERITSRLQNPEEIAFYEYGNLAFNLTKVSYYIGCDITAAKTALVKNLYNKGLKIRADYLFTPIHMDDNAEIQKAFNELKNRMIDSLMAPQESFRGFNYLPEEIDALRSYISDHMDEIWDDGMFASKLDVYKTVNMLKNCLPAQIYDFRTIFHKMYKPGNINVFLHGDYAAIEKLLKAVSELKNYEKYDKIQKLQISSFSDELRKILTRLQ